MQPGSMIWSYSWFLPAFLRGVLPYLVLCTLIYHVNTIFKLIILKSIINYKPIVKSYLFSAASLNYLKPMEYSCYHLLNFDEFLSLKHLKNVETSEVRNKVEEIL